MVGLLIVSITMLAMLTLYKDSLRVVMASTVSASDNSTRLSSAIVADRLLRRAGFGLDNPDPAEDLVTINGGTFKEGQLYSSTTNAPTPEQSSPGSSPPALDGGEGTYVPTGVIWSSVVEEGARCEGLITIATTQGHGLVHVTSEDTCAQASTAWTAINWTASIISWQRYLSVDGITPSADQWIRLTVDRSADCWPYGLKPEGLLFSSPVSVSVSYPVFNVKGVQRQEVNSNTCLVNFS